MSAARNWIRRMSIRCAVALRLDGVALTCGRRYGSLAHVVNFHGTPNSKAAMFRAQLQWVRERFEVVDLETFSSLWRADTRLHRPALLLTFDDGLASNYHVAAPALEAFGMRGVFFVNPAFAECRHESARDFFLERLAEDPRRPVTPEEWTPMSPEQMRELARRGHGIGNHTYSHVDLSRTASADLRREIVDSRDRLREWTGTRVNAFAWPYRWDAITREAWGVVRDSHRFCFAACAGIVRSVSEPHLIWRTHLECHYPAWEYRFGYSGLAAIPARAKRLRLQAALQHEGAGVSVECR